MCAGPQGHLDPLLTRGGGTISLHPQPQLSSMGTSREEPVDSVP